MTTPAPKTDPASPAGRERQCAVTRALLPESQLVRFAIGPGDVAYADVAAKAPGRGVWVTAQRALVEDAVKRNAFSRACQRPVTAPKDLADQVEARLAERCLANLGFARRAGEAIAGADQVRALLQTERPAALVEASDGSADGRGKVLGLAKAAWGGVPVVGCFDAETLGQALGREPVVHVALRESGLGRMFLVEAARLGGFRPLTPEAWGAS